MKKLRFIKIIGFFIFIFSAKAQDILPFVANYSKQDYNGDNQIWNVVQGSDHAMYFANNHFFLRYNGVVWEKYTLPNKTIIRSVFAHSDKVYSGSYNEFGYWKRENGVMKYKSLSEGLDLFKGNSNSEEIWKIFEFQGKIFLQSFSNLYIYDFKSVKKISIPTQISYAFSLDNRLILATTTKGLLEYKNGYFETLSMFNSISGNIIHGMEKMGNQLFICTQKKGIFELNNNVLKPWSNSLNSELQSQIIITAKKLNESKLVVGTASNGVYIIDMISGEFININRSNFLLNNSILSIYVDREHDIWLGLDNGIAHVEQNSPYRIFSDQTGKLGSVYTMASNNSGYLLGSNHGLFSYNDKNLNLIPNSQGQVWHISKLEPSNYSIGHNDGTFIFSNGILKKIAPITGGWQWKKNKFDEGYIQANYTGIAFYKNEKFLDDYTQLNKLIRPIRDFIQISSNELILADNHKGLFLVTFDAKFEVITSKNLSEINKIKSDFNVRIFNYKNQNLFFINDTWYSLDTITYKLTEHALFNANFKAISEIIPINNDSFAVVKDGFLYIVNQNGSSFSWMLIPQKYYKGKLINNETKVFFLNGNYHVNIDDGFLIFNSVKNTFTRQKVIIEVFADNVFLKSGMKVPFNEKLTVHFISEFLGSKKTSLYYKLDKDSITPLLDRKIALENVASGNHTIEVFVNDGYRFIKMNSFQFEVNNPWYLSIWMFLIYILIFGIILFLYYKWNKIRYVEKLKLKEEEIKHRGEILQLELKAENKLKLQEVEKQLLENQVQSKANELAGKSLSIAKQYELIETIQIILESETSVQSIKSKIGQAIKSNTLSKNEWKSFENNLLKSNESFVQKLMVNYPSLTSKDIKLCIYLKMNLSSKEIAPLMNISYRGVELHRYRLRKKLSLSQDCNLNVFMNTMA